MVELDNIRLLILEGVKEKALEDFIKKIIQGTEWQGKVFIAGGYVRDEFMGKDPKDLDLLVNAPNGGIEFAKWITKQVGAYRGSEARLPPFPKINYQTTGVQNPEPATEEDWEKVRKWQDEVDRINASNAGSNPVIFHRFGTAKFNLRGVSHNGVDLSDMDVEAVMPRKEQYAAGSRKPLVGAGNLKDDVERRDFTVNSLLKDLTTGEILDLTGMGKDDIKAGIIRTPLNPDKIFTDDPLRMLRAIRFAVKYNWKLPLFMIKGLKKNANQLQNISQERIRDELNKMLVTGYPHKAIEIMRITGLLKHVVPELIPLIKLQQNKFHKDDAFDHTMEVLSKTNPVLIQRLMALFHDIGKAATKTTTDTGIHFYGHEEEGAKIAGAVMRRLKYPNELIQAVISGIQNHMRLKHGGDTATMSDKNLRSFVRDLGDNLENTLDVIHADNIAHADAASMPNQIANVRERLKNLPMNMEKGKLKLPIDGKDLIDMGVPQGKLVGKIKSVIEKAVLKNPNLSKEEAIQIAGRVMKTLIRRGQLKEQIITEAYDLPAELALEVENITKSAIGWIYSPFFRSAFLKLDTREKQHDTIIKGLRNFVQTVKTFHETAPKGSKRSMKVTIYESFTWENLKKNTRVITVTMEKDQQGTTKVTTAPKYGELEGYFWEYGDWADPQKDDPAPYYKKFIQGNEEGWKHSKEYKEEYIFGFIHAFSTCEKYKSFKSPTYMIKNSLSPTAQKLNVDNNPYVIKFEAKYQEQIFPIYFNVEKDQKSIRVKYPNFESGNPKNPYIYMTLISQQIADYRGLDDYAVDRIIKTAKHEAIHITQDIKKSGIHTGLPKGSLLHIHNPEIRGKDVSGTAIPGSIYKDPEDKDDRVIHAYRDVEFKSNLYNMVEDFKNVLGDNMSISDWNEGFKLLISDITGQTEKDFNFRNDFRKKFRTTFTWNYSTAKKNLQQLYKDDIGKFRQYVKEIYKLLFVNPEKHV